MHPLLPMGNLTQKLIIRIVLQLNRNQEVLHYRILRTDDFTGYILANDKSGNVYATLVELIEKVSATLRLFTPCFGSPYVHLFVDDEEDPVNYMRAEFD